MKKTVIRVIIATVLASATVPALQAQDAGRASSAAREGLQRIKEAYDSYGQAYRAATGH